MRIISVMSNNYRNLNGIKLDLNSDVNFIVGENNLGKTNFLDLMNIIFNKQGFESRDFFDSNQAIEVAVTIQLSQDEQGLFEDFFDPSDDTLFHFIVRQDGVDEGIVFTHRDTKAIIPTAMIRRLTYVGYDSMRNPANELNFSKNRGPGKFLNHIVIDFIRNNGVDEVNFIQHEKLAMLLTHINKRIEKIKFIKDFKIVASTEDNVQNLLSKVIVLKDDKNFNLQECGYGIQYLSLYPLCILEKVLNLGEGKLQKNLISGDNGEKYLPLVIGLDEPEIHLHPYMQRSLVKYLKRLVLNQDSDFKALLKMLFDIDGIKGQIIIATHSPNILLNDYKQITRLYKVSSNKLIIKSGCNIELGSYFKKHLHQSFIYIKEAFFSRCVILVEGFSEIGAMSVFAERMAVDFDEKGISVIQTGGADTIPPLMELLSKFGIQCVAIMDADKYKAEYAALPNLFHTKGQFLEEDIYDNFNFVQFVGFLEETKPEAKGFFIGNAKRLGIPYDVAATPITYGFMLVLDEELDTLKQACRNEAISSLKKTKNAVFGSILATKVTEIPEAYRTVINKAVEMADNVE